MRSVLRLARLATPALLAALFFGCATTRTQADDAYARGDYMGAATLYAEAAAEDPRDSGVRRHLEEARGRALDLLIAAAEERMRANDAAGGLTAVTKLVDTRAAWKFEPNATAKARIAPLTAWIAGAIKNEIVAVRDKSGAFAAEAALNGRMPLVSHPEFGDAPRDLKAIVSGAGAENCTSLSKFATPGTPYLDGLIAAYCTHFGAPPPNVPVLPDLVSNLDLDAKVVGLDDDQKAKLATTIDGWLKESIWYAPTPVRIGHAHLGGTLRSTFGSTQVTRQNNWIERVPYQTTETYQEPYQESYSTTETYTESVPYTTTESYSATCGYGSSSYSCSQTRSVTHYRSEMRTRPVTKYRTAYRTATRVVTMYREEPRVYTYDAIEKSGTYRSDWSTQVNFGIGWTPMVIHRANVERQTGYDHDADFAPAGVKPSRATLMTHEAWVASQVSDLGRAFAVAANAHWARSYCARPAYGVEDAARCVYLRSDKYPPGAVAPLTKLFGKELGPLLAAPAPVAAVAASE